MPGLPSACAAPMATDDGVIELGDVGPDQAGLADERQQQLGVVLAAEAAPGAQRAVAAVLERGPMEARVVAAVGRRERHEHQRRVGLDRQARDDLAQVGQPRRQRRDRGRARAADTARRSGSIGGRS